MLYKIKLIPFLLLLAFLQKRSVAQSNAALQIPALCYHNILPDAAGHSHAFTISLEQFRQHMKMLHDSGYHSILPAELYEHFTRGASLPPKPVLISFDDSHDTHYSENHGILAAFQLSGQRSLTHPLYTIRRLQVAGSWSAKQLSAFINTSFR